MKNGGKGVTGAGKSAAGVLFQHTIGVPGIGSRFGLARFIDCIDGRLDGFYTDDQIEGYIESGDALQYVSNDGRILPASAIGENGAINLFIGGAAEIEEAVLNGGEGATLAAVAPIMAIVLGAPTSLGVVDFYSAGRLWALTGYALGKEYMYERDSEEDAKRLFEAALLSESRQAQIDPVLTFDSGAGAPARLGNRSTRKSQTRSGSRAH